jgi:hypothetical protein
MSDDVKNADAPAGAVSGGAATVPERHPALVTAGGLGAFRAMVGTWRWNGWTAPYFERDVMAEVVTAWRSERSVCATREDMWEVFWDGDVVVARDYASPDQGREFSELRFTPNEEGLYSFGGGYVCWELVDEPWPNREADLTRIAASARLVGLDAVVRARVARISDGPFERAAFDDAYEALERALIAEGIPVGRVSEALYHLAARTDTQVAAALEEGA